VGVVRQAAGSRLSSLTFVRRKMAVFLIFLGVLLIANAAVPPLPSFFPEVFILLSLLQTCEAYIGFFFIICRFFVCFFNCIIFYKVRQKNTEILRRGKKFYVEMLVLLLLSFLLLLSLTWLSYI
jgi:formate hydrogenlyase subunit 3/multisubunit Na+/H+ antiporter MnhD subunit